ncbi:MAG TPA: Trm112 family protein [Candidatus Nanoarchaeia archaeon]|nr:Trm112 family protein [Candidatus Nanoarchaeia archaeon]
MAKTSKKTTNSDSKDPIPKDLFEILACPLCRSDLKYSDGKKKLVCTECGRKFPIEGIVPVLLPTG